MTSRPDADFFALQEALLGRYSLERELGRGGMGIVYLAHDVRLDRPVALKLLPPDLAARPTLRERFLREARTSAKLSHPNIVPIHAVEEVDDHVFFVMTYVEGQTLGERIRERGPLPPSRASRLIREVAWALAYAHGRGVVHRDIKPDNILLEEGTGRALVTDFGIALVTDVTEDGSLTGANDVLGTAEFMSPEQAAGEGVDARSDLYSLGVVGHYMLSGELPFRGDTVAATLAQHLTRTPPPLAEVAPEVPTGLARALDRCLAKEPDARFADGEELADALSRTLESRREFPVPLRVFLRQTLNRFRGWGWFVFALLWGLVPVLLSARAGEWSLVLGYLAMTVGLGLVPVAMLAYMTRKLLVAGYGRRDLLRALDDEVATRREERAFEFGGRETWVDRLARGLTWAGLGGFIAGTASLWLLDWAAAPQIAREILGWVTGGGLFAGSAAAFLAAKRHEQRIHVPGERWLKFWKGGLGRRMFELAGVGAKRLPAPETSHRPTVLAIGMAAERLYEQLPKELRRAFTELPEVVRGLEEHAEAMRARVEELKEALTEAEERKLGDGRGAVEAGSGVRDKRASVVAELRTARDAAETRLGEVVASLESIRLELLRLHAGSGSVGGMTEDLGAARALSADVRRLLDARQEVDDVLGVERTSPIGEFGDTPTPTPA